MNDKAIADALGLENAYGYHIEAGPRPSFTVPVQDRRPARWYPCIEVDHTYTGCLGEACPLEICWTETASISYEAALRRRFHPTDGEYAASARCLQCSHARETAIPAIDARRGVIHLFVLHCERQCWRHPISAAAFVRRRIPARDDLDLAHCPEFEPASEPIPAVERQRIHLNELVRARRAASAAQAERHHG